MALVRLLSPATTQHMVYHRATEVRPLVRGVGGIFCVCVCVC